MKRCLIGTPIAAALFGLMSLVVPGRGVAAEPDPRFKAFFDAADPNARQAAIAAIVDAGPDPMDVERALHQGRSYPADPKKGWQAFTHTGTDGKARPYHVYVPKSYDRPGNIRRSSRCTVASAAPISSQTTW